MPGGPVLAQLKLITAEGTHMRVTGYSCLPVVIQSEHILVRGVERGHELLRGYRRSARDGSRRL